MNNKYVCHDLPANEYAYSSNPPGNMMTGWYEGVVVAYSLRGRRQTRHPRRLSWPIKKSLIPGVVTDNIYGLPLARTLTPGRESLNRKILCLPSNPIIFLKIKNPAQLSNLR